jgi:hypothetical protein
MEGIILLGLASAGYLLNKDNNTHRVETDIRPPVFQNTNTSIYDLQNVNDAQNYEKQLIQQNFKQSLDNHTNKVSHFNAKDKEVTPTSDIIMGLDGNPIQTNKFLQNDQGITIEPFFSGEGPASINFNDSRILNQHQGGSQNEFYQNKQEANLNLPPQQNIGNVFGMGDTGPAMEQSRYIPGMYRTDERPFEQEMVPHIDQNSEINRDIGEIFAQRNSIDNTRALSNQKVSFGSRVIAGKGVDERGNEGQVFKHLPEQSHERNPNQWLVTTGAVDAASIRPAQIIPETNRQYLNRQEMGSAAPNGYTANEKRPMFKKSDKQQLTSDTIRNAFGTEIFIDSDHMQTSYTIYPNEREVTQERTYEGNIISTVPGETRQLQDSLKPSLKETTLNPANPNGFTSTVTTLPEERLQDTIKTSKKETVLFDHVGNAQGSTFQGMAQDQYFRADLNPNKEIISQGRSPTTESVKLANGMESIHMDIQKIESDYFTHHITGVDKVYQEIPTENICKFTNDKDTLDNDKLSNRIEGDLLDPFKHNPYTHSLHSFAY